MMRWFEQLTGRKASVKNRFNKREQQEFLIKAHQFRPPLSQSRRYFTDDEEEMFVIMLEEAHNAAFPYDRDALKSLATSSGKKIYGKDFQVGNTWVRCFENRWKERLAKVKCGSIDRSRGKKATAEVRDASVALVRQLSRALPHLRVLVIKSKCAQRHARSLCPARELIAQCRQQRSMVDTDAASGQAGDLEPPTAA